MSKTYYNDPSYDPDSQSPRDMRDMRPWWRVIWDSISGGGPRGQPFDPADAAGVKSGTVTDYGQTGRPNREENGAQQIPGSSMSYGLARPIVAEQARGPSETTFQKGERPFRLPRVDTADICDYPPWLLAATKRAMRDKFEAVALSDARYILAAIAAALASAHTRKDCEIHQRTAENNSGVSYSNSLKSGG